MTILSTIGAGIWVDDLLESIEAQSYAHVVHLIAKPAGMELRETEIPRTEFISKANFIGDYQKVCSDCAGLYEEGGGGCTTPPTDIARRREFEKCLCSTQDSRTDDLLALEKEATLGDEATWLLYMNDDTLFSTPHSLAHLMAELDSPSQILLFRRNTSSVEQERSYRKKVVAGEMEGMGFVFHSSLLSGGGGWDGTRCGLSRLFARLSSLPHVTLKWTSLVPIISHPLSRFPPTFPADSFKQTILLFETPAQPKWLLAALEMLRSREFEGLVQEVVVVSAEERAEGSLGEGVVILKIGAGEGLSGLAGIVETSGVVLMSDSVSIDKVRSFFLGGDLKLTYSHRRP